MAGAPLTLRIRLGRTLLVPLIRQPSILAPLINGNPGTILLMSMVVKNPPTRPGLFQAPRVIPWGGSAANIGATMRGAPLILRIRLGAPCWCL